MSDTLLNAVDRGDLEAVRTLITEGVDVNYRNLRGPFSEDDAIDIAVCNSNHLLLRMLLDAGARNRSFIREAIANQDIESVAVWLGLDNIDVNGLYDYENAEPILHDAAFVGSLPIARMLVDAGADVNYHSPEGVSALARAHERGHVDVVRYLWELSSKTTRRRAGLRDQPYRESGDQK